MIDTNGKNIDINNRIINCRVQSLCDLLAVKGVIVSPHAVYLACFNSLLTYTSVFANHMRLPMISIFCDNIEKQFFDEFKVDYEIRNSLKTSAQLKKYLDIEGAYITLCDANSVLRGKKNKVNFQIGVCSGITLLGYRWNDFIYSQPSKLTPFSIISAKLLEYSRAYPVFPSAPNFTTIHIVNNNSLTALREKLMDLDFLTLRMDNVLNRIINSDGKNEQSFRTIQNIDLYVDFEAKANLISFLEGLYLDNNDSNALITKKVVELQLRMLRKSMISGTATCHRAELAESIRFLGKMKDSKKIICLADGFNESARHFRNIARILYGANQYIYKDANKYVDDIINLFSESFRFEDEIISAYLS